MGHLLLAWLITSVSLYLISRIPALEIEIDKFETAAIAAAVFGLLNTFVLPVLKFLTFPINVVTLGAFSLILNVVLFAFVANAIDGIQLRNGVISAIFGAFALSITTSVLSNLLF